MLAAIFQVPGVVGLPRHRTTIGEDGKPHAYESAASKARKHAIAMAYRAAAAVKRPLKGPVAVHVETFRPIPKSRPKRVESEPDTFKPDGDNVLKLVLDALNGVAYVDDCQVVEARIRKNDRVRGEAERTVVRVFLLEQQ